MPGLVALHSAPECDGRAMEGTTMTKRVKAAVKQVAAYFLSCPACGGEIESPCGSLMFTVEECDGKTVTCFACGVAVKLPNMLKR